VLSWIKNQITDRWACWRINRWLRLRREGVDRIEALGRSLLTADVALLILDVGLGGGLSQVGIATARGGSIRISHDFGQITLLLKGLADLSPVLPVEQRKMIAALIGVNRVHDWGGVRNGADAAYELLEPQDRKTADEALGKAILLRDLERERYRDGPNAA
jgi:hypothetical protein